MLFTPTPSQTVGPYLHLGLTDDRSISRVAGDGAKGERVWLTFRVLDGEGVPVPDAMIELWQADSEGNYVHIEEQSRTARTSAALDDWQRRKMVRAHLKPSGREACRVQTEPFRHRTLMYRFLAAVFSRDCRRDVYFAGEPANAADPVLALVPENRRATLLAQPDPARNGNWIFEVNLRGAGETVFFDV